MQTKLKKYRPVAVVANVSAVDSQVRDSAGSYLVLIGRLCDCVCNVLNGIAALAVGVQ